MNYDMKQSGKRIQQLRVKNGFTQEQVAEVLNIDRSFYTVSENATCAGRPHMSSTAMRLPALTLSGLIMRRLRPA